MTAVTWPALGVGQRVLFIGEKQCFKVRAATTDGRYVICTKPFNPRRTVLYTVIDFEEGVRGTDNLVFSIGYDTDESLAQSLAMFEAGEIEVSHRNRVRLRFADHQPDSEVAAMVGDLRESARAADERLAENRKRWACEHEARLVAHDA